VRVLHQREQATGRIAVDGDPLIQEARRHPPATLVSATPDGPVNTDPEILGLQAAVWW
jgi:hypothetical protein